MSVQSATGFNGNRKIASDEIKGSYLHNFFWLDWSCSRGVSIFRNLEYDPGHKRLLFQGSEFSEMFILSTKVKNSDGTMSETYERNVTKNPNVFHELETILNSEEGTMEVKYYSYDKEVATFKCKRTNNF